jgi:hypothetical protein
MLLSSTLMGLHVRIKPQYKEKNFKEYKEKNLIIKRMWVTFGQV